VSTPIILVPLDGSLHSLDALPVAHTLAAIKHATLHVLQIRDRSLPPLMLVKELGLREEDLRGTVVEQREGSPGEQICRAAKEWEDATIVMCTHAGSPTIAGALGRCAAHVLTNAGCPVVLVRPERGTPPWDLKAALVAHDGTPSTSACIGPAAGLARDAGARLTVLHVAAQATEPMPAASAVEPGTISTPRYVDQRQHEWPAWASEFSDRLASSCPIDPSTLRLALAVGDPGEAVVRYAREHEIDLIVLAWHGSLKGERARVLKAALLAAPCPVMVLQIAT